MFRVIYECKDIFINTCNPSVTVDLPYDCTQGGKNHHIPQTVLSSSAHKDTYYVQQLKYVCTIKGLILLKNFCYNKCRR